MFDIFTVPISWIAVIAAAAASMVVGAAWFHPKVFGAAWMKEIGKKPEELNASPAMYAWTALAAIITAYGMAIFFANMGVDGVVPGLVAGFLAGEAFVATSFATHAIFHNYTYRHWMITASHQVVSLMIMGGIIGAL